MPRQSEREAIVEHGFAVLHRNGLKGAGIAEITAAAGVPKGSFCDHFESKAFATTVLDSFQALKPLFAETLLNEALPGATRLGKAVEALSDCIVRTDFRGCLLGIFALDACDAGEGLRSAVNARFAAFVQAAESAFAAGEADGTLTSAFSPADAASLFVGAFEIDPTNVVSARRRLLDRAAAEGLLWHGYHAPFPALGRIAARGDAYEFVPVASEW